MRTHFLTVLVLLALLAAVPVLAQSPYGPSAENAIRFRAGAFTPDGESQYWDDNAAIFGLTPSDFESLSVGGDFRWGLGPRSGLLFSVDIYSKEEASAYLDFIDSTGRPIVHDTELEVVSATVAYVLDFASRQSPVVPYVGVGGGAYDWTLTESGDFIDFDLFEPEIFTTTFEDSQTTLGWFFLLGVEFPVSHQMSIFGEARWQDLDEDLGGDFEGLGNLDLSGRHLHAGIAWRF
ncbi:MAG: outer membrane beta-barrel protein [Acidobacteriota bacterium]